MAAPPLSGDGARRPLRHARRARALAHQQALCPRSPAGEEPRRLARRAGARGLRHRLGHADRRGPVRLVRRRVRPRDRPRGAPRRPPIEARQGAPPRLLPRRHARRDLRRRAAGARRVAHRARRAGLVRRRRPPRLVDAHRRVRRRRARRRDGQRAVAAHAVGVSPAPADAERVEARELSRPRMDRPGPRRLPRPRDVGQRQRVVPGRVLPALRRGALPRRSPDQGRVSPVRRACSARGHPVSDARRHVRARRDRAVAERRSARRSRSLDRQAQASPARRARRRRRLAEGVDHAVAFELFRLPGRRRDADAPPPKAAARSRQRPRRVAR